MLELVALGSDPDAGRAVAERLGGTAYLVEDGADPPGRTPLFRSLVRAVTSDLDALAPAGDVARYVSYGRHVKRHPHVWRRGVPTPGVVAAFGLVHRPGLTHAEGDAHWRDVHVPLALRHHPGMWDYVQCSIVHVIDGVHLDGIALCGFASEEDLRDRFFDGPEGREAIRADVARLADTGRSPRRVVTREWCFAP